ncbi:NO-inducible flavohemoprotein [Undibacterium sp. SXout11W]|uniref:NO-inducible flavohemoprotein n=1 Tax=Undibacterium sp. SXout11W TaxID=3413050 RepID=UPI003BF3131C
MLDSTTRELIKSTVPVLTQHGVTLTRHFYARMFAHNPELKPMFNQTSQQAGRQQQALAMAVLAYAEHIDNPEVLQPVLTLVANKHASLGIRAEHYPIVGKHLLASIQEVLGDASSEALIAAWAAAYGQLADFLIAQENNIYQQAANQNGGWSGWRSFRVEKTVIESDEIKSFYLTPADGGQVPQYRPGQYISVKVHIPTMGISQARQYSLSGAPGQSFLRISVKREQGHTVNPEGLVSNELHKQLEIGSLIELAPPMGDYFLHEDRNTPVVLISAGVGITPKVAMLEHLIETNSTRSVSFIHACRHGGVHAFKQHVKKLSAQHPYVKNVVYYEVPREQDLVEFDYQYAGRLHLEQIANMVVQPHADYYVCGPVPFMQEQINKLKKLGVDAGKIHAEAFGSGGIAA